MLTFLSPFFLVGLLSAAVPLIIHLSRSRRTKTMKFSTTRFFTDQFLRSYRMSRLKEAWLLLCRMALCAIFALALARPLLLPKGPALLAGGSRAVVLVLDDSASMGYTEEGTTLFERARAAARSLVEGLRPGDTASVVLAGRRAGGPVVLFPEPTPALGDVLQAIDGARVGTLGTDLSGAVARAEAIVRGSAASSKEVYVLSDLQDSGWQLADEAAAETPRGDVLFVFVQARPRARAVENLAVTAVQYASARPMAGVPFSIRPHLVLQGEGTAARTVRLVVDGKPVAERPLKKLQNGRWSVPRFDYTFASGGWHTGYVEVSDPTLPQDNRRYFALEALDSVRVLAVDGAPSQVARLDELFFLRLALTANPDNAGAIEVDAVSPSALTGADFGKYPLIVLANVESLPAPTVEALEGYVDRGGSLLVFLGDQVNAPFYNASLAAPTRLHGGLLPGRLLGREGNPAGPDDFARFGETDDAHAAISAFRDPEFASLGGVGFKAFWGIEPSAEASVLMRANTGAPLLVEKPFGKGRVVAFASTCDRGWTNFPVRPAFLPWVHRLVGYLAQEPLGRAGFFATGEAVPIAVSASEGLAPLAVKRPDGTFGRAVAANDPAQPLAFHDTAEAGVYTLLDANDKDHPRSFAVNLEGYESDLTYLDDVLADRPEAQGIADRSARIEAGLKGLLPGRALVTFVDDPRRASDASLAARRGFPLWDAALIVALLLALVEPWLANRISLRHYVRAATARTNSREAVLQ
ncbi:MAG: BatA domain-containing protein [Isosphaeraceae bacterium]|nr:BatA domain-containing protein [Isosphaeraceae bacterium]